MCSDPIPVVAFAEADAVVTDVLELPFDLRERSRLRARLLSGDEIGIDLPVGTLLHHGSKLRLADGRVVAVEACTEQLLEVRAADAAGLARIAYHVGNRHVPVQVGDGWLRILPDHVLEAMVKGLGGKVQTVSSRFEPERGAYGHSHVHHQHDDEGHGGRIHVMDPGPAA
jgi:urease accessory protein